MVISFLPAKYKWEGTFMENTCNFVGYVRHLSDLNESSKGNRYCRFTLENINHGYHNFIRMIVFGNKAEKFIDEISEAQLIYVVCEMQINVFEGQVRYNFMLRDYHSIDLDGQDNGSQKEDPIDSKETKAEDNKPSVKKITDEDLKKAYDETINSSEDINNESKTQKEKGPEVNKPDSSSVKSEEDSNNDFFSSSEMDISKDDDDFFNKF